MSVLVTGGAEVQLLNKFQLLFSEKLKFVLLYRLQCRYGTATVPIETREGQAVLTGFKTWLDRQINLITVILLSVGNYMHVNVNCHPWLDAAILLYVCRPVIISVQLFFLGKVSSLQKYSTGSKTTTIIKQQKRNRNSNVTNATKI